MSRLRRVEEVLENAERRTTYEDALANCFWSFLRNRCNLRGFSAAERRLMEQVARGSGRVRALRGFADMFALNSQAGIAALVAGAALPIARMGSRATSNAIVLEQAAVLERMAGQSAAQRAATDAYLQTPDLHSPLAWGATKGGLLDHFGPQ